LFNRWRVIIKLRWISCVQALEIAVCFMVSGKRSKS
jgi:hypothetical protein